MQRRLVLIAASLLTIMAMGRRTEALPAFDPNVVYRVPLGDAAAAAKGDPHALITIVEWSDFICRYCNHVEAKLEQVERLYPGQIRWVYRHFPLAGDDGTLGAQASFAAAAQGKFWPMHDRLFAVEGRIDRAAVELIATDLGLDMVRFRGELDAGTYRNAVEADADAARALGVTGTPTFFVNGRAIHGNQPLSVFVKVIDEETARARTMVASHPADLYDALTANGHAHADIEKDGPDAMGADDVDPGQVYTVGLGLPGQSEGPDDALVTIIEWSDFECQFCRRNAPVLDQLRTEFGADLRIVYRYLPLAFHRHANMAAEAAVEAGMQGKFWQYHDQLYAHQTDLTRADLEKYAAAVGLDMTKFRRSLDERSHREVVAADGAAGSALGVSGTPTMFINGQAVVGAQEYGKLQAVVAAQLEQAKRLVASGLARRDVYAVIAGAGVQRDKADPSRIPVGGEVHVELGAVEREAAVVAACRNHDDARAADFAHLLPSDRRAAAAAVCSPLGVDIKK